MKAAVVGAGAWGRNIVRTLNSLGELGAVAEVFEPIREKLAEDYPGVPVYPDYAPIIESDIKAVCVAAQAPDHYKIGKALLEAGKDVFIEKPMTLSSADAEDLVRIADERGAILMVGHLLLYQPAVAFIREAIASGMVGKLYSIHQTRCDLGRARDVENVLWSLGVHDVAVALSLIGEAPISVKVSGQAALNPGIEDDVHLQMMFPGGVHNYLHCSWLWPYKDRGMKVIGDKAMLVYNELEQSVTLYRKHIGPDLKNVDEGSEVVFQGAGEPLKLELQHFLECCEQRKTPLSDGRNGLEVVRVLEKASEELK